MLQALLLLAVCCILVLLRWANCLPGQEEAPRCCLGLLKQKLLLRLGQSLQAQARWFRRRLSQPLLQALFHRWPSFLRFNGNCAAFLLGPLNAKQWHPLRRWPTTAGGVFDQQTDIQTITVWGGVEEFPIPLLSCLSCLWLPRSDTAEKSLPPTHTLCCCVRGASLLYSLRVCLSGCVSVWVCGVCVCVTHIHSLSLIHSLHSSHSFTSTPICLIISLSSLSLSLSHSPTSVVLCVCLGGVCVRCMCVDCHSPSLIHPPSL